MARTLTNTVHFIEYTDIVFHVNFHFRWHLYLVKIHLFGAFLSNCQSSYIDLFITCIFTKETSRGWLLYTLVFWHSFTFTFHVVKFEISSATVNFITSSTLVSF